MSKVQQKRQKTYSREECVVCCDGERVVPQRLQGKIQRVVKHSEVHDLVHQMHSSVVGGCHFGQNATHQKISDD